MSDRSTTRPCSRRRIGRRAVLAGALRSLAGVALAPLARVSLAAEGATVTRVADGFAVVSGAGGNVLVRAASGGQVLVDSGSAAGAAALETALAELPGAGRVETVFNTHWHRDQTGSNAAFGRAGATIVAHEKTRQRLATGWYVPDEDRYEPPLPAEAQPVETFYTSDAMDADGERIEYGYLLEAHTDGDIFVHFRNANVIAVGGAASPVRDPELDWFGGGWLGGRVDSLALLLARIDGETKVVPADGPVIGRAEVQAEHDLMLEIFEIMVELVRQGDSAQDMLAAGALDGLGRTFEDPLAFLYAAHKGLWAHHNTLSPDIV